MRLFAACAVVTALWGVSAAGPAVAQVREDSVVGSGSLPFPNTESGIGFDIDAHSGPSGENPTGTAGFELINSPSTAVRGTVTCLAVTGNRAVIGFDNSLGAFPVEGGFLEVIDGSTDTAWANWVVDEAPTVCPSTLDLLVQPLQSGNIVVTDAPPLPTSKAQCKKGGWRNFPGFKNQGQCVAFVQRGRKV